MILKAFSIRDGKAEIFNQPFYAYNENDAKRSLTRLAEDPNTNVGSFPEDFDLYEVGSFDDQTGHFDRLETPRHVTKAIHVKRVQQQ